MGAICSCVDGDSGAVVEVKDVADVVAAVPGEAVAPAAEKNRNQRGQGKKTIFLDSLVQSRKLAGALSVPENREEFKQLFDRLDKDQNGAVDAEEFAQSLYGNSAALDKFMGKATLEQIRSAFRRIDKDHNSTVSFDEFVNAAEVFSIAAQTGEAMATDEGRSAFEALFKRIDKQGDGKITYQEFVRGMCANGLAMQELLGVQKMREETLREAFNRYDLDGNQMITWDEFEKQALAFLSGAD
eukprot:TRINITY_DN11145_c0_g1_i2.p1 TRINITY_DN11145_c0_g1~~TRINITY_DN11145_c0_g1_i2.p1  ORF type:complete len:253 (-),score=63.21 TRINITY_DN11145_c0_g1_i2:71-796(-)